MPRKSDPDPPLPYIFTYTRALAAGLTRDQIRQRVRSGRWTRLAHGVYRSQSPPRTNDPFEAARRTHAELAVAHAHGHPGSVIAGFSAAAIHDIPTWSKPPERVCLVRSQGTAARNLGADVHTWALREGDIFRTQPPTTSFGRTWVDVSRTGSLADALVAGDYLLRELLTQPGELRDSAESCQSTRGMSKVHLALLHVNRLRESPLESASWAYFLSHGIELPAMQIPIRGSSGRFIGRVDFLWERNGLIGECDGRMKYADSDSLYAEKRREDELREEGYRVIRWGATHLRDAGLAERLRRTLSKAS